MPGLATGTLAAAAFRIGAAAADASDRIIYNDDTGALFFDQDGTGGAAQVRFATLDAEPGDDQRRFFVGLAPPEAAPHKRGLATILPRHQEGAPRWPSPPRAPANPRPTRRPCASSARPVRRRRSGSPSAHLMLKPAFARLGFGAWSRVLVGQFNRGHYRIVLDSSDKVVDFL